MLCGSPFNQLLLYPINDKSSEFHITPCCPGWLKESYRNYFVETIRENESIDLKIKSYWRSKELNLLRKSIIDGSYHFCDKEACPYYFSSRFDEPSVDIENKSIEEICLSDMPYMLNTGIDRACNLSCPSCRNNKISVPNPETGNRLRSLLASGIHSFFINSSGETFINKYILDVLRNFTVKDFPNVQLFRVLTNGTALNKTVWDSLSNDFKDLLDLLEVSVDAACESTYSTIRVGGNFSITKSNLYFLSELRKLNEIRYLSLSYVLQAANIKELPEFIKLAIDLKVDQISIKEIENYGNNPLNYKNNLMLKEGWRETFITYLRESKDLIKNSNLKIFSNILKYE